jgi:SIT family siderophore-iron:H+ symporter-like MFS transporter
MIPFQRLRHRAVWGALGVGIFFNFAVAMQAGYLYTVLVVAFDFSVTTATRISTVYGFMAFAVGPLSGLAVYRVRRLRPFILSGVVLFTVAFGLLVRYRGGGDASERAGVIAGQVLLGLGGGLFGYSAGVAMQVMVPHKHVAVLIALYMAAHNIGVGFGSSVSGSIWTQVLPSTLADKLGDAALAMQVLADPFTAATQYPVGSATRAAMIESYQRVQQILCAVGLGLCVPLIAFASVIPNLELTDEQTLAKDDGASPTLRDPKADNDPKADKD